ncbi:MAG: MerR family transcriptional regulator [Planctomycetes bacterium]|nr:MerR family transcriptional regulator [Planctomycetota bacterium]
MHDNLWKVGELATQTGVSVRTLHYYDEIGLLSPSQRSGSGHRLYGADDVVRLQQIKSCRQLGFSLAEIRDLLSRPDYAPQQVIQLHIERLEEQIQLQRRLCSRLEAIAKRLRAAEQVSVDEFVSAIKEIEMVEQFEKYYTPQQLRELEKRRQVVGEDRMREAEGEWKQLLEQIRSEMAKGTDPASETMQRLAKRYQGLIDEFTGGNKEIEESLRRMYKAEPDIAGDKGYTPDPKMAEYVGKSLAAAADKA